MQRLMVGKLIAFFSLVLTLNVYGDDPASLPLKFDASKITMLKRGVLPPDSSWRYYVTTPKKSSTFISKESEISKFIEYPNENSCRLMSVDNYVGLFRLVDPKFEKAKRMTWKWSVAKHPRGGKLGGPPHDTSMEVYVCFRTPKAEFPVPKADNQYDYTVMGFCWTANTGNVKKDRESNAQMPAWPNSPRAEVVNISLRDGPAEGVQSEEVNLQAKYNEAFPGKTMPPVWGIVLLGDSNDVVSDVGEMSTDATIRDIQLHIK